MLGFKDLSIGMKVYIDATGYGLLTVLKLGVAGFHTEQGYLNYNCSWIDWRKTTNLNGLPVHEQSQQYTFDDLIDAAVKAYKDNYTSRVVLEERGVSIHANNNAYGFYRDSESINDGIKFIQSLYKETFVIESEEDIKRIRVDAIVTLANEIKVYAKEVSDNWINAPLINSLLCNSLNYVSLKGATVEQERGRDD